MAMDNKSVHSLRGLDSSLIYIYAIGGLTNELALNHGGSLSYLFWPEFMAHSNDDVDDAGPNSKVSICGQRGKS